jgi:hypothetical protein
MLANYLNECQTAGENPGWSWDVFCRLDQCSRNIYLDDYSCLISEWLPSLFYTMPSNRDILLCAAKDETSVEFMRPLLNSWAECSVVISC